MRVPTGWRRALIHTAVAVHLLAVGAWAFPTARTHWERWGLPWMPRLQRSVQWAVRPYTRSAGLAQDWRMFSRPPTRCLHLEAEVGFADGTRAVWEAPRLARLGLSERYGKERYRKWAENVLDPSAGHLWPDAARYVARRLRDAPSAPVTVHLVRRWADLALPATPAGAGLLPRTPEHGVAHAHPAAEVFFRYVVRPEDLR